MTVKFKFDYVLNLHNRHTYISAIEKDGMDEEIAYKRSLVQVNKGDIKSITRAKGGGSIVTLRKNISTFTTVEEYDEILDVIHNANLALDIMNKEKIYIFDNFVVDSDELSVCNNWSEMTYIEQEALENLN